MHKGSIIVVAALVLAAVVFLAVGSTTHAQGSVPSEEILKKLEEIISGEKAILQELAAVKEELRIVKIRVTQQQ